MGELVCYNDCGKSWVEKGALFIPVHWLCDVVWLSLVSILVYKTQSLWGRKFQEGLFIACSLLLIGFGIWFLVSAIPTEV
mgnify:CR=1 FL=1